jgi:hypothetical protein
LRYSRSQTKRFHPEEIGKGRLGEAEPSRGCRECTIGLGAAGRIEAVAASDVTAADSGQENAERIESALEGRLDEQSGEIGDGSSGGAAKVSLTD